MDRDPRRWEGSRGSELGHHEDRDLGRATEHYGQGQSGYSAGRYGDDRAQQGGMQNRNEMWSPSPGGSEDRHYDAGTDDRFTGRGASHGGGRNERGYDPERGYGGGRGFDSERGSWRGADPRGVDQRGYAQSGRDSRGYDPRNQGGYGPGSYDQRGFNQGGYGPTHHDPRQGHDQRMGYQGGPGPGPGSQHMGYQGGPGHQVGSDWSPSQGDSGRGPRGSGPHRGKGPQGYQRSDDRIREQVCEALADDDQIDASQIQVTVKDGEVTLTGTVDNRRIRREAEDCVASVSGVRDVHVQLRVKDERQNAGASQSTQGAHGSTGTSDASSARDNHLGAGAVGKHEPEPSTSAGQDKKHRA